MLVYLARIEGNLRTLPSGAQYRATRAGWVRLNHPKNKHARRAEKLHGRTVKPHRSGGA